MCRKRPFATHGQRRRPVRAAVCRIPCLILCLADVDRKRIGSVMPRVLEDSRLSLDIVGLLSPIRTSAPPLEPRAGPLERF